MPRSLEQINADIEKLEEERDSLEDLETCVKWGKIEEGDNFAGIIEGQYWCADCCEPLMKADWEAEHGVKK